MKKWNSFFGYDAKQNPLSSLQKVSCHWDSISVPDVISFRLSNISKNLSWGIQFITRCQQNAHQWLYTSMIFLACRVSAQEDCVLTPNEAVTDVYLTQQSFNASALIRHTKGHAFTQALNATCDFLIGEQQPGLYKQLTCLCPTTNSSNGSFYDAILYGQNMTANMMECLSHFMQDYCRDSEHSDDSALSLGGIIGITIAATFLYLCIGNILLCSVDYRPDTCPKIKHCLPCYSQQDDDDYDDGYYDFDDSNFTFHHHSRKGKHDNCCMVCCTKIICHCVCFPWLGIVGWTYFCDHMMSPKLGQLNRRKSEQPLLLHKTEDIAESDVSAISLRMY